MQTIFAYSIYDKKSKKFDVPFFANSDVFARRHFIMISEKKGTMLNRFVEDYDLYKIGSFCLDDGKILDIENYQVMQGNKLAQEMMKDLNEMFQKNNGGKEQ